MRKKKLFLLATSFPYGSRELFLNEEINYVCAAFDEVHVVAIETTETEVRTIPENCSFERIDLQLNLARKLGALGGVFDGRFWRELRFLRSENRAVNRQIVNTILVSLYRSKMIHQRLNQCMHEEDDNVFYSYWSNDGAIALCLSDLSNSRRYARAHGWDVYFEANEINYLPFRGTLFNNLDTVFPVSEMGRNYCIERWKLDASKVAVKRLGVVAAKDHVDNGSNLLVSCSHIVPLKRVHLIVDALSELAHEGQEIKWIHFGAGRDFEQVKSHALASLAEDFFEMNGAKPNKEILDFYAKQSPKAFINLSTTEGVPVSIMEAMAHGIPVIATDVGGTSEIVNAENGILLSANPTIQDIKDAILRVVLANDDERSNYQKGALKTWESEYNATANYTRFANELLG